MNFLRTIYLRTIYRIFRPITDRIILFGVSHTVSIISTYISDNKKYKAMKRMKQGFMDHRAEVTLSGADYDNIFKRISEAYKKAKEDQKEISNPAYRGTWNEKAIKAH